METAQVNIQKQEVSYIDEKNLDNIQVIRVILRKEIIHNTD